LCRSTWERWVCLRDGCRGLLWNILLGLRFIFVTGWCWVSVVQWLPEVTEPWLVVGAIPGGCCYLPCTALSVLWLGCVFPLAQDSPLLCSI
jgi:hypothetical protein